MDCLVLEQLFLFIDIPESDALVVSFTDVECRNSKIVGGKGASLANMLSLPYNDMVTLNSFVVNVIRKLGIVKATLARQHVRGKVVRQMALTLLYIIA